MKENHFTESKGSRVSIELSRCGEIGDGARLWSKRAGIAIRYARFANDVSEAELAKDVGVNIQELEKIESGQVDICMDHFARAAYSLGYSPSELLALCEVDGDPVEFVRKCKAALACETETATPHCEPYSTSTKNNPRAGAVKPK